MSPVPARHALSLLAMALLAVAGPAAASPPGPPAGPGGPTHQSGHADAARAHATTRATGVAIRRIGADAPARIDVRSPQVAAGAAIPARHTAYGDGISPGLEWSAIEGARAYAVVVEDPDAPTDQPFVHWLAWNIPADTRTLPERIPAVAMPATVARMRQGTNGRGTLGYFGPRPPAGDPPHRYHFQVFALDRSLELSAGASRDQLLAAMDGHMIATGELVATSQAPQDH